ncbi:MAG TPA: tetratricopeptide repeat protein [Opitutaceae bacterium]|nr:tetratricopeptide repeat protein [Opitutaceae bacterium]
MPERNAASLPFWMGAVLAAAVLAAYAGTLGEPLLFESASVLADNPTLRQLGAALRPPHDGSPVEGRPVLNLSLALNYAAGGAAPDGYHLANLAIHALAALVLFGIVRRTLARFPDEFGGREGAVLAGCAALLWAVHPLQTEAVTNVIQRAESLMGLFYLLTLYCFIRGWRGLSVAACLLGMGTKEVMVSAPLIVLLYDRTFVAGTFRRAWSERRGYYLGLAATWLLLGWLLVGAGSRHGTAGFGSAIRWFDYLRTQAYAVTLYLGLAIWPHHQIFDYGTRLITRWTVVLPSALVVLAVVGFTAASILAPGRRWHWKGFLGAWFLALLAPTALVPVATQTLAEHRMYLPLAALAVATVLVLRKVCGRRWEAVALVSAAAAAGLGAATVQRNRVYRSEEALWSDTVAKIPYNERAHNNLGNALYLEGRAREAAAEYERALELQPEDNPEAQYNLGNCLLQEGRPQEAAARFREAIRLAPLNPDAHNQLGDALAQAGRLDQARAEFERAESLDPGRAEPHYNLGNIWAMTGHRDRALAEYRRAAELDPGFADARAALERLQAAPAGP